MGTDASLKSFGEGIDRLISRQDLSRAECHSMFRQVLTDTQPDLHQGAFLAALTAKGPTPPEIAGAWQAIVELDTATVEVPQDGPLVDNCGTGMDSLKTFNVSSAAAVVAAAGGVRMARHGARGLTSACGTVDLLEAVGIAVDCDVASVARSIETCGIGLFNGMSPRVHPRALFRILSQIRFGSILNIAASLASPCRPTHAVRGVYTADLLTPVSRVMREIGYRRAMVVHGFDAERRRGMDELSTIGETVVHEFHPDGREETYNLAPEDVGIRRAGFADIASTGDVRREAVRFLKVVAGTADRASIDIACLNAGAILYVADQAATIAAGIEQGREIIDTGRALSKLCAWRKAQADPGEDSTSRFHDIARQAGLADRVAHRF
jgi:anthranilate phosphoribosyltransferase